MHTFTPHETERGWVVRHEFPNGEARYSDEVRSTLADAFRLAHVLAAPAGGIVGRVITKSEMATVAGVDIAVREIVRPGPTPTGLTCEYEVGISENGLFAGVESATRHLFTSFHNMLRCIKGGEKEIVALIDFVAEVIRDYEREMF